MYFLSGACPCHYRYTCRDPIWYSDMTSCCIVKILLLRPGNNGCWHPHVYYTNYAPLWKLGYLTQWVNWFGPHHTHMYEEQILKH